MVGNWFTKAKKREIKEIQIVINKDVLVRINWNQGIVDGKKQ